MTGNQADKMISELQETIADLRGRNHYLHQQSDMIGCRVSCLELELGKLKDEEDDAGECDDDLFGMAPGIPNPIVAVIRPYTPASVLFVFGFLVCRTTILRFRVCRLSRSKVPG